MNKIIAYMALFLVCISAVFAANTLTLNFYDENGNQVTHVETSIFQCTDSSCKELTGTSARDRIDYADSGSTNIATLSIPKTSTQTWYIAYMFAEESNSYLPRYYTFAFTGDYAQGEEEITLEKKDLCRSTIQSFSVTNSNEPEMPIVVDVAAALEADTYSAFQLTDEVYPYGMSYTSGTTHVASQYNDWYSAETTVYLTITKEGTLMGNPIDIVMYTDSETINIQAEGSKNVQFTWTPTREGTYTATVTTEVIDAQCLATEEQSSSETFTIVSAEDNSYCYTLIDNLAVQEIETGEVSTLQTGETYTVTFDKISNAVADDGSLTSLATALDIAVLSESGNTDYAFSDTMDANANTVDYEQYSFAWTPASEGDNTITVDGIATGCTFETNNPESQTLTIYVSGNQPPVADAGGLLGYWNFGDYTINFDGSGSYDPDGYIVDYSWDFGDGTTGTGVNPTHTYADAGTYTATLTVTDNDDATDDDTATVRIYVYTFPELDTTPSVFCHGPYEGYVNEDIQFSGTAFDIDGDSLTLLWDFGDSATSTEEDPIYAYSAIGVYDVTFTVTDEDGNSNVCSTTATITEEPVENEEPTISCTFDGTTGIVNEPVTLEVEATDSDGTIEQYAWDFGDSATDSTTEDTTEHTYTTANTYTVTVTATDDDGDSASCSGVVIITEEPTEENEEPVALCNGPYEAYVGETITFDGSDSYDMDGYLTSASWNFGDSAFASAVSFTGALTEEELQAEHAYDEAGVFTVTLTVFDEDSAYNTCETTATITEEPVEPVDNPAIAVASANPESGEPTLWVQFSSEGSSGDEPLSYYWTFGDGETSTRANPGHYYDEEGTYTAVLTIVDADGDSDSDSVTITVADELENLAGRHYYIDGIAMSNDGIVNAGDTLELYVGTENIAGIDKERVVFNAIIQELGIYETTTEFDLDAGDKEVAVLYLEIPADTMPGIYYIRITVSDDDVKRIAYRDIIVTA